MKKFKTTSKPNKSVGKKTKIQAKTGTSRPSKYLASCPDPVERFMKSKGLAISSAAKFFSKAWIPTLMENYKPSRLSTLVGSDEVANVQPIDILFGRGSTINQHSGNVLMRQIAAMNRKQYIALSRQEKPKAADALVAFLEKSGCRFVEKVNPTSTTNPTTYRTVRYDRVVEKWMQTLREIPRKEKRQRTVDRKLAASSRLAGPDDRITAAMGLVGFQKTFQKTPDKAEKSRVTRTQVVSTKSEIFAEKKQSAGRNSATSVSSTGRSKRLDVAVPSIDTAGLCHNTPPKKHGRAMMASPDRVPCVTLASMKSLPSPRMSTRTRSQTFERNEMQA